MTKRIVLASAVVLLGTATCASAQSIAGSWRTQSGETARINKCGKAYCITLRTGKYKGQRIGKMTGVGSTYKGSIRDPAKNKTYSGSATVSGRAMAMSGCVFGGLICRSQTWTKR